MFKNLGVIIFFFGAINIFAGEWSDFKKKGVISGSLANYLLQNGTIYKADISAYFFQTMIHNVKFEKSTFFRAAFTRATLADSHFSDCHFEKLDFEDAILRGMVSFQNIKGLNFGEQFVNCTIFDQQGASFHRITRQDAMKLDLHFKTWFQPVSFTSIQILEILNPSLIPH